MKTILKVLVLMLVSIFTYSLIATNETNAIAYYNSGEQLVIDSLDFTTSSNTLTQVGNDTFSGLVQLSADYLFYQSPDFETINVIGADLIQRLEELSITLDNVTKVVTVNETTLNINIVIRFQQFETGVLKTVQMENAENYDQRVLTDGTALNIAKAIILVNFNFTNHVIDPSGWDVFSNATYSTDDDLIFRVFIDERVSDYLDGFNAGIEANQPFIYNDGLSDGINQGFITGRVQGRLDVFNYGSAYYGYLDTASFDYRKGFSYAEVGSVNEVLIDVFQNGIGSKINPGDGEPFETADSYDYILGSNIGSAGAYESGYIAGGNDSFQANIGDWIVPAIVIILIVGGYIGMRQASRRRE